MQPIHGIDVPPELVTGVVQHEYFKFQVQKQVEEQVQAYVSKRIKVAGALTTVLLTVLGAFGVEQYYSFTGIVADVRTKSAELADQVRSTEKLVAVASAAVQNTEPLVRLANANVQSSQLMMQNAGTTAKQTGDLAQAVLGQAQTTQAAVQASHTTLTTTLEAATKTMAELKEQEPHLQQLSKSVQATHADVTKQREDIETEWKEIRATSHALTRSLDFERQLAEAKTFEIVLLRDGRSVEIVLPDFRDVGAESRRQYKLRIETTRIKDNVDFQIMVNGGIPVHSFKGFAQGKSAEIPGAPFDVRVDSIYHAKLAYDFVLLRIKPRQGSTSVVPATLASTGGQLH